MDDTQLDNIFLGILQNCGEIGPFLEAIFSFLARRTDFFRVMKSDSDKMGFPPGVAEKVVMRLFKKYQDLIVGKENRHEKREKRSKKKNQNTDSSTQHPEQAERKATEKHETPNTEMPTDHHPQGTHESGEFVPSIVESTVEVTTSSDQPSISAPTGQDVITASDQPSTRAPTGQDVITASDQPSTRAPTGQDVITASDQPSTRAPTGQDVITASDQPSTRAPTGQDVITASDQPSTRAPTGQDVITASDQPSARAPTGQDVTTSSDQSLACTRKTAPAGQDLTTSSDQPSTRETTPTRQDVTTSSDQPSTRETTPTGQDMTTSSDQPLARTRETTPTGQDVETTETEETGQQSQELAAARCSEIQSAPAEESKGLQPGKLSDCYNGAALDNYVWSQTIHDIDIRVPVPHCIRRARNVAVQIKNSSLKVFLKGNGAPPEELKSGFQSNILMEGKLQRLVKCEDCVWSLDPGNCIQINLEKTEERYWTAVIEGDPEIDKSMLDTTRDISDFDEQTQSDYQQVMYDHRQKQMGKPTSKEQKSHELLKKAWNAKGSPFAGTPFDPSKVNIS